MTHAWKKSAALPVFLTAVLAVSLNAQTTSTISCPGTSGLLTSLSIEHVLTLADLLTTITPNVPASQLAALAGGAAEIRSLLVYNPQQNQITDTIFTVTPGSPIPTPLANIPQQPLEVITINISQIYLGSMPSSSLMIVGTVSSSAGAFGNVSGAPAAIALGYKTSGGTTTINNITELIAGQAVAYGASGQGTLTFPSVSVTPPGSNPGAPVISINPTLPPVGMGATQVNLNPYTVNASATKDPNGLPLTFQWTSNNPVNFVPNATVANPTIYFGSGSGDYTIKLTVTNSAGVISTYSFILEYINK